MKNQLKILGICLFALWLNESMAQGKREFVFSGKITDHNFDAIGGVLVKNLRTNNISITDTGGYFTIDVNWNDSLFIHAMGHELKIQPVKPNMDRIISLVSLSVQLNIVEVVDQKSWENFKKSFLEDDIPGNKVYTEGFPNGAINPIPPQYRSNEFTRKPSIGQMIISPISSLAYALNDEEKQKRKLRKILKMEGAQGVYLKALQKDSIREYLEVPDSLMTDFIVFCHNEIKDKYINSVYYYHELIISLYPKFIEERKK